MKVIALGLAGYATILAAVWAMCRAAANGDRQLHHPPLDQIGDASSAAIWADLDPTGEHA